MDLRKTVWQELIALWDDDEAMQQVLDFLLSLKGTERQARIEGLPYTRQERQEALIKAEADVMAGNVSDHEEVVARIQQKMEAWK